MQFLHAIILDSGFGFIAVNQYFPTRLICLQFLQHAAILAHKNAYIAQVVNRESADTIGFVDKMVTWWTFELN